MLSEFRKKKKAAFIPFVVAGDPSLEATEKAIDVLVEEGADLLELGVPFSDALADGPVIQAASERASKKLDGMEKVIPLAAKIHGKYPKLPIILFTYFNPIFKMGVDRFCQAASQAGVSAVLVVDLPPEESEGYRKQLAASGLKTVFLASPTTAPERVSLVGECSTGFVYYVSRTGVTGVQTELSSTLSAEIARVRQLTDRSLAVGFGISTGQQARVVAGLGDAVVVGSAFVKLIAQHGSDLPKMEREVRNLARELVTAIRGH